MAPNNPEEQLIEPPPPDQYMLEEPPPPEEYIAPGWDGTELRAPTLRQQINQTTLPVMGYEVPIGHAFEPFVKGTATSVLSGAGAKIGSSLGLPGFITGGVGGAIAGNVVSEKVLQALDDYGQGKIPSFGMEPEELRRHSESGALQGLLLPVFNLVFDKGVRYVGDKVGQYGKDFGKRKFEGLEADLIKAKKIDPEDLKLVKAFQPSVGHLDDVEKPSMFTFLKEARQDHGVFDKAASFADVKKAVDEQVGNVVTGVNPATGAVKNIRQSGTLGKTLDDQFQKIALMETAPTPYAEVEQALLAKKAQLINSYKAEGTEFGEKLAKRFDDQVDKLFSEFVKGPGDRSQIGNLDRVNGLTLNDLKDKRQFFQGRVAGDFGKALEKKPQTKAVYEALSGVFKDLQDGKIKQVAESAPELAEQYFKDSRKYYVLKQIQPVVNKASGSSAKRIEGADSLFGNIATTVRGTLAKTFGKESTQTTDDMFAQSQIARRLLGKPVTGPLDIRDSGLLLDKLATNLDPRQWGPRAIGGAINFVRSSIDNRIVRPVVIERSADKVVDNWDGIKDSFSNLMLKQAFSQSQETGDPMQDASIMRQQLQQVEEMTDGILAPLKKAVDLGQYDTTAYELSSLAKQFPEAFPQPKTGVLGEVTTGKQVYFPDVADRQIYAKKLVEAPDLSPITKGKILSGLKKNGYVREVPKL